MEPTHLSRARLAFAGRWQALKAAETRFRTGLLRGSAQHSLPHGFPGPPSWLCFTAPPLRPWQILEALASIFFTNLFWVGLWDLLDNTVFPSDTSGQMLLLVCLGVLGLYLTDSLYDPPQDTVAKPRRPAEGMRMVLSGRQPWPGAEGDGEDELRPLTGGTPEDLDGLDKPCVPPRFELRRFTERVLASTAAVLLWTGVWNELDANLLPKVCSYNACSECSVYGEFPCAWYKIMFVVVGLAGQYLTRTLYRDDEVSYVSRGGGIREQCAACGWCGDVG